LGVPTRHGGKKVCGGMARTSLCRDRHMCSRASSASTSSRAAHAAPFAVPTTLGSALLLLLLLAMLLAMLLLPTCCFHQAALA
jgi:hypothetical protein